MPNQTVTLAFVAETEAARRRVKRLEDAVDDLGDEMNDVDGTQYRRDMDRNTKSTKDMDRGLTGVIRRMLTLNFLMKSFKWIAIYTGIRLLLPLISALGAATFALTSSMGAFAGLIGLYPGIASAAISTFGALKFATMGLGESLKVLMSEEADPEELAAALQKTGPQVQKFASLIKRLRKDTEGLRRAAQEDLFEGINRGLQAIDRGGFLAAVLDHFGRMNGIFGDIAGSAGEMFGSQGVMRSVRLIMQGTESSVRGFGSVLVNLIEILTHVTAAAQPLVQAVLAAMDSRVRSLLDRVQRGVRDGTLQEFFLGGLYAAQRFFAFLGMVGRALRNINDVLVQNDLRERFVRPFEEGAAAFEKYTESIEGQQDILRWFQTSADSMDAFYRFLGRVVEVLRDLGGEGEGQRALAYFLTSLSAAEGPLDRLFQGLNDLDLMLFVDTVIDVLNALADFAVLLPVLEPIVKITGHVARAFGWVLQVLAALPDEVKTVLGWAIALKSVFGGLGTVVMALGGRRVLGLLLSKMSFVSNAFFYLRYAAFSVRAFLVSKFIPGIALAFKALGAAIIAHPVIAVIVGLIALFVILWTRSERFREIVTGAFNAVLGAAQRAWSWLQDNWRLLTAALGPVGWAINLIVNNFDQIKVVAMAVWSWIRDNWRVLLTVFAPFLSVLLLVIQNFDRIKTAVTDAMNTVREKVSSAVSFIRSLPGTELLIDVVQGTGRLAGRAYRAVSGIGGDSSAQRGASKGGGGLGATLAMHAAVERMTPGSRRITNATRGKWSGSEHHKGRALDLTGPFLGAYARNLAALGGAAERHSQGSSPHTHAVFPVGAGRGEGGSSAGPSGDTRRPLLPRGGSGGGDLIVHGPIIGQVVANDDVDVERATYRALQKIIRERRERA